VVTRRFRVGASAAHNSSSNSKTNILGAYAGVNVGPVTVLGETDFVFDSFESEETRDRDQFIAYLEGDIWVRKGVNVKISHGYHQPTAAIRAKPTDTPEDERTRTRAGVEVFPLSFLQVSAYFTRLDNAGDGNDLDRLSVEAHLHF
jgi:hypothetical protein